MARNDNRNILALALLGGILAWVLSRERDSGPSPKAAAIAGSVGTVQVSQESRPASVKAFSQHSLAQGNVPEGGITMGTHGLRKTGGDQIMVTTTWRALTVDADGNPLRWPYRLDFLALRSDTGQVFDSVSKTASPTMNGFSSTAGVFPSGTPAFQWRQLPSGLPMDFEVQLFGAESDDAGNPTTVFTRLDVMSHPSAVIVN